MYTIKQFRENLRQAFNDADQGHEVVIERYGQKYQLVSLVDKPLPGHTLESRPGEQPLQVNTKSHGPTIPAKKYRPQPLKDQKNGPR